MWDAITALSSLSTTIIAVFGLYYIRQTYLQTVGAVDAAKDAVSISERTLQHTQELGHTQNRAWLYLEDIQIGKLELMSDERLSIELNYTLTNSGATPAIDCKLYGEAAEHVDIQSDVFEENVHRLSQDLNFSMPPRGSRKGKIWVWFEMKDYDFIDPTGLDFGISIGIAYNLNGSKDVAKTILKIPMNDDVGEALLRSMKGKTFPSLSSYFEKRKEIYPETLGNQFKIFGIYSTMK